MQTHWALERLVIRDNVMEAFACLTPEQLVAVVLRLEGLPDGTIAHLLGTSRAAVNQRFFTARLRILDHVPELRVFLSDPLERRPRLATRAGTAPLEAGWLCKEFTSPWQD